MLIERHQKTTAKRRSDSYASVGPYSVGTQNPAAPSSVVASNSALVAGSIPEGALVRNSTTGTVFIITNGKRVRAPILNLPMNFVETIPVSSIQPWVYRAAVTPAYQASDGSMMQVTLDADGHVIAATGVGTDGISRKVWVEQWRRHDVIYYSEGQKPTLTFSLETDDSGFTFRALVGEYMLVSIWDFSRSSPPIINTVDRWQSGVLIKHDVGEDVHDSDVYKWGSALLWQLIGGVGDQPEVFRSYSNTIRFFVPVVQDMAGDLVAYLNAQTGAPDGNLSVETFRHGLFSLGRATLWGLGGFATGLAAALGTSTPIGAATYTMFFLIGFDVSEIGRAHV
jgi:hypothetical protein